MDLQPGLIIGQKYRIVRLLGQGGMGAVYEGENVRIHRRVAIKTLHATVAGKGDFLQRFEREAQAAGRIGSEHIVEVLDMGDLQDGSRFMVMEYLDGTTLGDRIVKQGRIPARAVVVTMSQLLDGLGAAHQAGIIHRDLKPANIFLLTSKGGRPDFVKILDFGVSKFNLLNSDEMSMTSTGAVMGTPYYMSPEQAKGARAIDFRSDLYSVGVILYEAITGQVPFNAQTFNELIFKIALESPPPAEQFVPNLDPAFGALVRKSMARDPAERFQTAAEMKQALLAWARDFDLRSEGYAAGAPQMGGTQVMAGAPPGMGGQPAPTQMLPVTGGAPMPVAQPPQPHRPLDADLANPPPHLPGHPAQPPVASAKKSSAGLVIGLLLGVSVLGAGAWFAYTRFLAPGAASAESTPAKNKDESGDKGSTDKPATDKPATDKPATDASASPTDSATPDASGQPSGAPSASAAPSASGTSTAPRPTATVATTGTSTGPRPTATVKPTATATATTKPTSTGRTINGEL